MVPGDVSSASFLVAATALIGSRLSVREVGVNPSRCRFLEVLARMGVVTTARQEAETVGEPVGSLEVESPSRMVGTVVSAAELPLVIDEVPVLAALAAHAEGPSWLEGTGGP